MSTSVETMATTLPQSVSHPYIQPVNKRIIVLPTLGLYNINHCQEKFIVLFLNENMT